MSRRPPRSTLFPTRRSSDLGLRVVARDHGRHAVLERAGAARADAVHEEGEGHELAALGGAVAGQRGDRSEEHTSELQSRRDLVCRLLLEKKKISDTPAIHLV